MKVIYEFNWEEEDCGDLFHLKIHERAHKMYKALTDISDYLRGWRKGWNEDDADAMEDRISDLIGEADIWDIE